MAKLSSELAVRRGLLFVALSGAIVGVLSGLVRLGLLPSHTPVRGDAHGPLLVLGLFGTLIALERSVALARTWAHAAPLLAASFVLGSLLDIPGTPFAALSSSAVLVLVNLALMRRQWAGFMAMMVLGSISLLVGNLAWVLAGLPVFAVLPAWLSFFVLTIVAERLELSRLTPRPAWAAGLLWVFVVTTMVTSSLLLLEHRPGLVLLLGASLAAIACWQLVFDVARRTIVQHGLPRHAALGVLLATAWLLVAGLVMVCFGFPAAGPHFDAAAHALLVGYVFSMVFAHAPIVLPVLLRVPLEFRARLYVPLAVLHGGLALRVVGDLAAWPDLRLAGALANVAALLVFGPTLLSCRRANPRR